MAITFRPIGVMRTEAAEIPKHWSVSDVEGALEIREEYRQGLRDIRPGSLIILFFLFHESPSFAAEFLVQHPRGDLARPKRGVFDLRSPIRPNPIGMSIVNVIGIDASGLRVKGIDMFDGTPILDIKPFRPADYKGLIEKNRD
ncbi:MAG: tRNA (N6-threonylcarbamoyladenosine(37)-N6)-methyltransferase TrmO [Deltaproteobacteria bacterium]|nr:tRNA (N6-threonylcarbamoyladenosine(37)-N6)-methyltransferase TrmO [Deltaproteobacteria bacterium]